MQTFSKGGGLVNSLINNLPVELHLPGYSFCGPGTRLPERLRLGHTGINPLDRACKDHDIAYSKHKDISERHKADRILEDRAWSRVKSGDATIGEKVASWAVTNIMKAKRKLGMGLKRRGRRRGKRKMHRHGMGLVRRKRQHKPLQSFRRAILSVAKAALRGYKGGKIKTAANMTYRAAKVAVKKAGGRKRIKIPRIIPIPKTGGIIPLLPLIASLGAIGSLAGGTAGVVQAVNKARQGRQRLEEAKRHNKAIEDIALGTKKGSGLYLTKYRRGLGLYLKKSQSGRKGGRGLYLKKYQSRGKNY